jgi:hypothetical protein
MARSGFDNTRKRYVYTFWRQRKGRRKREGRRTKLVKEDLVFGSYSERTRQIIDRFFLSQSLRRLMKTAEENNWKYARTVMVSWSEKKGFPETSFAKLSENSREKNSVGKDSVFFPPFSKALFGFHIIHLVIGISIFNCKGITVAYLVYGQSKIDDKHITIRHMGSFQSYLSQLNCSLEQTTSD